MCLLKVALSLSLSLSFTSGLSVKPIFPEKKGLPTAKYLSMVPVATYAAICFTSRPPINGVRWMNDLALLSLSFTFTALPLFFLSPEHFTLKGTTTWPFVSPSLTGYSLSLSLVSIEIHKRTRHRSVYNANMETCTKCSKFTFFLQSNSMYKSKFVPWLWNCAEYFTLLN